MADPVDAILQNIDKGDYLKVLLLGLVGVIIYQARQNSWLTKELMQLSKDTAKVLEGLVSEMRNKQ